MHRILWMGLLIVCAQNVMAASVYRCVGPDASLRFSDIACPDQGQALSGAVLSPNGYAPVAEPDRGEVPAPSSRRRTADRPSCNADADLRHLDLLIDSITSDRRLHGFLKAERQRVQACKLVEFSAHDRRLRDSALQRVGALRDSESKAAQREIETLYARYGSPALERKSRKRR